jgi:hypothetical protein
MLIMWFRVIEIILSGTIEGSFCMKVWDMVDDRMRKLISIFIFIFKIVSWSFENRVFSFILSL